MFADERRKGGERWRNARLFALTFLPEIGNGRNSTFVFFGKFLRETGPCMVWYEYEAADPA